MKILVVGGGGREHALAWKLAQSPLAEVVYVAPGNAGTAREPGVENVPIAVDDLAGLERFAREKAVGLTLIGPEAPLVAGIVDTFREADLPIFGPSRAASRLEGSKTFAKAFLARHGIPTAEFGSFTDAGEAEAHIRAHGAPVVVKADGLAAGKGVILAQTEDEAVAAARGMLAGDAFGRAGHRVVVESFLEGEEASFICMADGEHTLAMATSQDHKARDAGDTGPNTGGMGAYSPAPVVTREMHDRILSQVIEPTIRGMREDGCPYRGFLYAGLMISSDGTPRVLEYNCRFGDPETQPILLRLRSDLVETTLAALRGELDRTTLAWDPRSALGVVMAAGGYPDAYRNGDVISGLDGVDSEDIKVFHAGTREDGGDVVTSGGRVLCVTALGDNVTQAGQRAYAAIERIQWRDAYFRPDIGHRAVARERVSDVVA
ncbi:MAG: phosphoribosylamine--glycine ligase [Gammaproteobacteria bacterium]|jgi:phosphoribosylamine--glycine ligase|nr:phosphoribosylamine--glycine ligase [Gammaproteobacteria bacterium]